MDNHQVESEEVSLSGAPACPGIAIGSISMYKRSRPAISNIRLDESSVHRHVERFHEALEKAEKELDSLLEDSHDQDAQNLISAQIAMLKDPELTEQVEQEITQENRTADSAVQHVFENYLELIRKNHDEVLERSIDIADVRDRLIQILHNKQDEIEEGTILVASELSPREVISFSNRDIKGILTDHGGSTSHVAIIARSMNIPTVVGLKNATDIISADDTVILDGRNGEVIVHPAEETRKKYESLIEQQVSTENDFKSICKKPNETKDGSPFSLQANVEFAEELTTAKKYRAEGVGLLRTESIYLSRDNFIDQEQQESFYETILEITDPHPVTIRLFDAGGDKFFDESEKEQNPFLGWRGVRMLLTERELLLNQLKAILVTASKYKGRIRILVPMISSLDELLQIRELIQQLQEELSMGGVSVDDDIRLGIMVEVPSVAIQADLFAKHSDFMSIGTNDLTQYMLAVDRGNERISNLYDQRHPAIWRMIKNVADAAEKEQIPLSVCGELASDPISACSLVGMGINNLSMNAVVLPSVKQMLCDYSLAEMQQLSKKILKSDTLADINRIFSDWKKKTTS